MPSKNISNSLSLNSSTNLFLSQKGIVKNTSLFLTSTTKLKRTKVQVVERFITPQPSTKIESQGFNFDIIVDGIRKLSSSTDLNQLKSTTKFQNLKVGKTSVEQLNSSVTLKDKKSSTSGSFKRVFTKDLRFFSKQSKKVISGFSLNNSQTEIKDNFLLRKANSTIAFVPRTIISLSKKDISVQQNISLTNNSILTFTRPVTTGSTISLVPSTTLTFTREQNVSSTATLSSFSEAINTEDTKTVNASITLTSSATIEAPQLITETISNLINLLNSTSIDKSVVPTQVENQLSLQPSTSLQENSILTQQASTLQLISSTSLINDRIATKTEASITLTNSSSVIKTTEADNVSSTINLTPSTVISSVRSAESSTSITFTPSTNSGVYAEQILHPDQDISINYNQWFRSDQDQATGQHYTMIDELTPDDTDYIETSSGPSNYAARFGLTGQAFNIIGDRVNNILRIRHQATSGIGSVNLTVELYSGNTVIRQEQYNNISTTVVQRDITLTESEANQLSYNDLSVRFTANTTDGSNKSVRVLWTLFEIPNVEQ